MAYSITTPEIGYPPITDTGTVAKLLLGTMVNAGSQGAAGTVYGEGSFIYLSGVANTAVGSLVFFNQYTGSTALAGTGTLGDVAVAMSANGSGAYGWYARRGVVPVLAAASTAGLAVQLGANVGTTTSAAGSTGDTLITGATYLSGTGTTGAGLALVQLNFPSVPGLDSTHP